MRTTTMTGIYGALIAMAIGALTVLAAEQPAAPEIELNAVGQKLFASYSNQLEALKAEIEKALPKVDEKQKAAFVKAYGDEAAAMATERNAMLAADTKAKKAKRQPGDSSKQRAAFAKAYQLKALEAEIEKALPKVDKKQIAALVEAYKDEAAEMTIELMALRVANPKPFGDPSEQKAAFEKAHQLVLKRKPETHATATEALALAATNAQAPAKAMLADLEKFLADDKLDAKLAKCMVLTEATPRGLAEFAQQGKEQEALIETMLADDDLMKQMAIADGAQGGKYGQAMKIYADIQKASAKAKDGVLQRLALGVSLEHAVPVGQGNPAAQTDAPATVDPVKRYLHFEKAYLDGELDPCFKDLSVWDYRLVVNGDEPDDILAWGRKMLRNYRPDHISTSDYRWRYVKAVKTDVPYGSENIKYDRPELQQYQNIPMNGGVCGRRAFFGRFILRAFGVPTTRRPQVGHAALVHWTPDGWVINLGANWGWGTTPFGVDRDFLAHTQARITGKPFEQVRRAQLVGMALGEKRRFGFHAGRGGFWNGVALYRQRAIIEEAGAKVLEAVGEDIGYGGESKEKDVIEAVTVTEADRKIVVGQDGAITIPAVACGKPTRRLTIRERALLKGAVWSEKILFMKSDLGGMQLHYNQEGQPQEFEYTFDAPATGKYALTARVVTVTWKQHLRVAVNNDKEPIDIAMPFTVGMWGETAPIEVSLVKGRNVLCFSREEPVRGLTIKEFQLKPVK